VVNRPNPDAATLRYVALAGPTAAGKTAAAMAIARAHAVEIVSVDSALVYRGMDIGTAKPSAEERAAVPHHLIDIRDPLQPYSAAEFAADARRLISDISARGRLPLLVGGTMLYFKALAQGLDAMPPADPAIRAALDAEALASGWPALHAELARVDPVTAKRLAPNDSQRIQRALEVYRASGQPMSSFHTIKTIADSTDSARATAFISLEPQDRGWLHERIAQRFDAMLAAGFLDEVRALRARGDLTAEAPAMRCVGYRQAWEWLDAHEARGLDAHEARGPGDLPAISELRDKGIFATRQLAKRQLPWLRSSPERRVVACDDPTAVQQVLALVQAFQEQRA
jgi:tRNA dimethylallyltransferase